MSRVLNALPSLGPNPISTCAPVVEEQKKRHALPHHKPRLIFDLLSVKMMEGLQIQSARENTVRVISGYDFIKTTVEKMNENFTRGFSLTSPVSRFIPVVIAHRTKTR